jgi:hypothetical protein
MLPFFLLVSYGFSVGYAQKVLILPFFISPLNQAKAILISAVFMLRGRPLKNADFCSSPKTIPQDSGIGSCLKAGPVRARGMDAPSQRKNFNHPAWKSIGTGIHTYSISRIELKLHFV